MSLTRNNKIMTTKQIDDKLIASFDIGEKNFAYSIGSYDKLIKFGYYDVTGKKSQTICESCNKISKILEDEDWSICLKVVIEQQIRSNTRAQRLSQHVWSWFNLLHPRLEPEFVSSSLKTKKFYNGTTKLSDKGRKQWAVEYVKKLLKDRTDTKNYEYMISLPKLDDVADSYLQLMAIYDKVKL